MLIASQLDSSSNGYSIVNKNFLEYFNRDYVRCAVGTILNASSNTSYTVTHNLGTENVIVSAYEIKSPSPVAVTAAYSVPDSSTVVVSFDSFGGKSPNLRIVVMGALTHSTATVTVVPKAGEND